MSAKRSNGKFFLGITVAVLLPLSFYLVTDRISRGKVKMPGHYAIDRVDSQTGHRDTIYHQLADLTLTNQLGEQVSLNTTLKGKILVIDFFFTTCATTCPQLARSMKLLQTSFKKDPKKEASLDTIVQFISITIDPAHDSFPALRAYADRYGANHDHWWFLTGDKKSIYNFARNEVRLGIGPGDGGAEDFIHSSQFILVDKDRYIRGYYEGLSDTSIRKCADDIVLLTMERKHGK